jgi:hypothetical protein
LLGGNSREVADVLGEHAIATGDCGAEHFWIRRAGESKVRDRSGLNPRRLKRTGDGGRVHLVDEDLHRASAAAVSLR